MNKMTNKELPPVVPTKDVPLTVAQLRDEVGRAAQREQDLKERAGASGFLDKFFALFSDYSYRTHYNHKRKQSAASTRSAKEIIGELRAFYESRPRPWRPAGSRQRPVHAIRFRYRRSA